MPHSPSSLLIELRYHSREGTLVRVAKSAPFFTNTSIADAISLTTIIGAGPNK